LTFFYPTTVLVTGYEILYLWVARMVMSGMYLAGDIPFRHVVIHGLVRDPLGRKMSKSAGNVIDPVDVIRTHGADSLRFALARQATGSQEIPLGNEYIEAARRFANKIWNAARLVLSAWGGAGAPELPSPKRRTLPDRWLLSRHQACLEEVDRALEEFRPSDAAQAVHRFFWSEFCDWGLEAAKHRLYEGTPEDRTDAAAVLAWVLERSLRLLHPFMPFVTEEAWQHIGVGESVMVAPWPESNPEHADPDAEARFAFAESVVSEIRRFRKAHGVRDAQPLPVRIVPSAEQRHVVESVRREIQRLAGVSTLDVLDDAGDPSGCARLVAGGAQVLVPLAGILDPGRERARISKRIEEIEAERARVEAKLANPSFLAKAPPQVVEKERARLAASREEAATMSAQLAELG
jgi:valyl-tRNA synthetase